MKSEDDVTITITNKLAQGGTTKIGADDKLLEVDIQNSYNMGGFRTTCSLSDLIGLLQIWEFNFKTQTPNCFSREPIIILDDNDTEDIARRQKFQEIDYSLKSSKVAKFLSCWGSIVIDCGSRKSLTATTNKRLSNYFQSVIKDSKDESIQYDKSIPVVVISGDDCFEKFINLSLEVQKRKDKTVAEKQGKGGKE